MQRTRGASSRPMDAEACAGGEARARCGVRGRLARALGASLALALVMLVASSAHAQSHDVLIVGTGSPELARKLRAETAYAGFRPVESDSGGSPPATLRVLSRERVALSVEGVDGTRHFEQTLVSRAGERESFALRVVEELRARLVDVGWALPESAPADEASDLVGDSSASSSGSAGVSADASGNAASAGGVESEPLEPGVSSSTGSSDDASAVSDDGGGSPDSSHASAAGRVWLDAGIASSWASGGLGAVPQVALGAQLDLGAAWHARATSYWPLRDARLEADEGEARVAWTGFTATLARSLPLPSPWLAQAGLGGGLVLLDARGEARDDFSGRRERLYAGAYFAEASFGRDLASWLRLRATALAGVSAPRPVLRFDEREVASLGRFIGALTLGLDLTWPRSTEAP